MIYAAIFCKYAAGSVSKETRRINAANSAEAAEKARKMQGVFFGSALSLLSIAKED